MVSQPSYFAFFKRLVGLVPRNMALAGRAAVVLGYMNMAHVPANRA